MDEKLINEWAFGIKALKVSQNLGIYLGSNVVYIAQSHNEKGRLVLDQLFRIALPKPKAVPPPKDPSQMQGAELWGDFSDILDVLKPALGKLVHAPKEVVVCLSPELSLLRYFQMPQIDQRFWKTAIPLEAKKYIPFAFQGLVSDFQVFPSATAAPDGKPMQGVLFAVTSKSTWEGAGALMKGLNLEMIAMETSVGAYLRFLLSMDKTTAESVGLWVHFSDTKARALCFAKGVPLLFREADWYANGDIRILGISGLVDFINHKLGLGPLQRCLVSGASNEALIAGLSQEINLKVEFKEPGLPLGLKNGDFEPCAAIGSSFRFTAPSPANMDFSASMKVTDGERKAALFIFGASVFIAAFFIVLGLYSGFQVFMRSRELAGIKRDPHVEALFRGKSPNDIQKMISKIERESVFLGGASKKKNSPAHFFQDIADNIPENMWLTDIEFDNPLPRPGVRGDTQLTMKLSGYSTAGSIMEEQDAAKNFQESLGELPDFKDLPVQIQFKEKQNQGLYGAVVKDPYEEERRQEKRTGFEITVQ